MSTLGSNAQQQESKTSNASFDKQINNMTTQYQNINTNNGANVSLDSSGSSPKKKNAKKKELLKLQMPLTNGMNAPPTVQTAPAAPTQNGIYSVHEFFMTHVAPLYAHTSSRYLENLTHHPQFHLMQNVHFREMFLHYQFTTSLPATPLLPPGHPSSAPNFPNSPYVHQNQHQPKYFQNVMQHPLLSKTFWNVNYLNMQPPPGLYPTVVSNSPQNKQTPNNSKSSPRCHGNKKKQSNDENKFEPYMSIEEVEEGLRNKTLLEGVLRINPKQFQHAYISNTDRSEQDVLIDGVKNRNRALEGDIVVVQYVENEQEDKEQNQKTTKNENKQFCEKNEQQKSEVSSPQQNIDNKETDAEDTDTTDEDAKEVKESSDGEEKIENKQKKGKVVFIKEKVHTRKCLGNLKLMPDKNRQRALFVPRDYRIPRLNIPFTNWPDNFYQDSKSYENTLFLARIEEWNDIRFALGKIICNIGQAGDMKTETIAILAQTDLDVTPFGPEVRHLYPRLDYVIPNGEIKLREDCRKLCIFSIDPSNCRDIDDAVSCRKLNNGNYEIGVHISDVSYYLLENTILDEKVADKATTIYLVEKAFHMLPDDLCMLCSLFPGVDKLAFSVFWEITDCGTVKSHRFAKTVINSCCQLAYEHAQAVLDKKENAEQTFPEIYNGFNYQDVSQTIQILGKISAILKRKRYDGGALSISQPKISFHLSPTNGLPDSFHIYESKESHQLIEEFMLLANMTVAKRILDDHPQLAFLRCHPVPNTYMLKNLAKALKPVGIDLDYSSAGDLHKSLLNHTGSEADRGKAMVLNMLCAKLMTRAKYFCAGGSGEDDFHHYALNVPLYTHFTSPIRRYADIMVHRLLSSSLNYREVPKWDVKKVCMIASHCNKQKYNAKRAGELSIELYTLKYIELNSPLITEAVVVEIRDKYIDVIIVAMGLNRKIFFNNDFPGEFNCIKNEAGAKLSKMELKWKETDSLPAVTQSIEVFSILQVELHKGDDMVKVETKLVRPK